MEQPLFAYWARSRSIWALFNLQNKDITAGIPIPKADIVQGAIQEPFLSQILKGKPQAQKVFIAPILAKIHSGKNQHITVMPYWLEALINTEGQILPCFENLCPIIPFSLLEPTAKGPVRLAHQDQVGQFLNLYPPIFSDNPESATWEEVLEYANRLLAGLVGGEFCDFIQRLNGTFISQSVVLAESDWIEATQKGRFQVPEIIQQHLFSTKSSNVSILETKDFLIKSLAHLSHCDKTRGLTETERKTLFEIMNLLPNQAVCIESPQQVEKKALVQDLIASLWTKAALADTPPESVWSVENGRFQKHTVFELVLNLDSWPGFTEIIEYLKAKPTGLSEDPFMKLEAKLTKQVNTLYAANANTLEALLDFLSEKLKEKVDSYLLGLDLATQMLDLKRALDQRYLAHEGITARIQKLSALLATQKEKQKQAKDSKVLFEKALAQYSVFEKMLGSVPGVCRQKLHKLKALVQEQTKEPEAPFALTLKQLKNKMRAFERKADQQTRCIEDSLIQVQADAQQLDLLVLKTKSWLKAQVGFGYDLEQDLFVILEKFDESFRQSIFEATQYYWITKLLSQKEKTGTTLLETLEKVQSSDYLCVFHAHQLLPAEGCAVLSYTKRAVIFADTQETHRFDAISAYRDYALAAEFGLFEGEQGFSELEQSGQLASSGNLYTLLQSGFGEGQTIRLFECFSVPEPLLALRNALSCSFQIQNRNFNPHQIAKNLPALGHYRIAGEAHSEMSSLVNPQEAQVIVEWLKTHAALFQTASILIVTPFSAQKKQLQEKAKSLSLNVTVALIQNLPVYDFEVVIFSPTYTQGMPGPYVFEEGNKPLYTLVSRARAHLFVFGDIDLFRLKRNTASHVLGKHLFKASENALNLSLYAVG